MRISQSAQNSDKLHTGSKILSLDDIRTFYTCSEAYANKVPLKKHTIPQLVEKSFDIYVTLYLLEGRHGQDPDTIIAQATSMAAVELKLKDHYERSEIRRLVSQANIFLHEIITQFMPHIYTLMYGNYDFLLKVKDTVINVNYNAIYAAMRAKHINIIMFSPYINEHNVYNDPANLLRMKALGREIVDHFVRLGTVDKRFHLFWFTTRENHTQYNLQHTMVEVRDISDTQFQVIDNLITQMEAGERKRSLPCPDRECPMKKGCFPELFK